MPFSDPSAVDPEEMFVASLASCHMLWFLSIAGAGFRVDSYRDAAEGRMAAVTSESNSLGPDDDDLAKVLFFRVGEG